MMFRTACLMFSLLVFGLGAGSALCADIDPAAIKNANHSVGLYPGSKEMDVWNWVVRLVRDTAPAKPATRPGDGARSSASVAQKTRGARLPTMSLPSFPGRTRVTMTGAITQASPARTLAP